MYTIDLSGKKGVVFGVANEHSIAWPIFRILHQAGAKLAIAFQNQRFGERVSRLTESMKDVLLLECDVAQDMSIIAAFDEMKQEFGSLDFMVHSIAYANRDDLKGNFSKTSRDSFLMSLDISAYSLIPLVRYAAPLMENSGSVVAMTFQASERVFPGYNVMGTAKAALENEVRQLSEEYGKQNIRINAISAGPLETLASRGIHGFPDMRKIHAERAPLKRNITHEEVAKTALFLCSDLSSGITGTIIPVDAGYHIMGI
jgi:enoyl-[acyl-carrier protein] reductase I